ncbi:hypothetical protein CMK12_05450 [Candidatus Poribacteria bacterium]|nr:hypothetical protein [Candidatus Poribacteria bacterium]
MIDFKVRFLQGLSVILLQLISELVFWFLITEKALQSIRFTKSVSTQIDSVGRAVWISPVLFLKGP